MIVKEKHSAPERVWINANLATMQRNGSDTLGDTLGEKHSYALAVEVSGHIGFVLPMAQFLAQRSQLVGAETQIIDVQERWITPGLIDSHTHLIFAGDRSKEFTQRLAGISYAEIAQRGGGILSTVHATRQASVRELVDLAIPRLSALMAEGVTTIEIKSGYGLSLASELNQLRAARELARTFPVRISSTLLAAHALPPEYRSLDKYVELICQEIIPAVANEKLADGVDVFCESIGFTLAHTERIFQAAQTAGLGLHLHAEQLSNQHGSALAARFNAWSVGHLEWLDQQGVAALAQSSTVATLLPTAFYYLRETQKPPVELLRQFQVPMAVATDYNPGTAPLASLRLAMNMASVLFGLSPAEAWAGTTVNAAQALGLEAQVGVIAPGMIADLVVWDFTHPVVLVAEFGVPAVYQRIFAGKITQRCVNCRSE